MILWCLNLSSVETTHTSSDLIYYVICGTKRKCVAKNNFSCYLFGVQLCTDWTISFESACSTSFESLTNHFSNCNDTLLNWIHFLLLLVSQEYWESREMCMYMTYSITGWIMSGKISTRGGMSEWHYLCTLVTTFHIKTTTVPTCTKVYWVTPLCICWSSSL